MPSISPSTRSFTAENGGALPFVRPALHESYSSTFNVRRSGGTGRRHIARALGRLHHSVRAGRSFCTRADLLALDGVPFLVRARSRLRVISASDMAHW